MWNEYQRQGALFYGPAPRHQQLEQTSDSLGATRVDTAGCSHDTPYVAIIISVVPLWAILTTLIVVALLMFHKHIQAGEQAQISEQLTLVDYALLIYLFCSLAFFASTQQNLPDALPTTARPAPIGSVYKDKPPSQAAIKGLLIGCLCFSITFTIGLIMRYIFRLRYAALGGGWAYVYYILNSLLVLLATGLWIYTTLMAYRDLCSNSYRAWLLTLSVAVVEALFFCLLCSLIGWLTIALCYPHVDHVILPEEIINYQDAGRGSRRSGSQNHPAPFNMNEPSPSALMMPTGGSNHSGNMQQQWHAQQGPVPVMPQHLSSGGNNPYAPGPYMMIGHPQAYQGAKPLPAYAYPYQPYESNGQHHHQQPVPPLYATAQLPTPQTSPALAGVLTPNTQAPKHQLPTLHHTQPNTAKDSYQQQTTTTSSGKLVKKAGSNESTGSTYYQQLMKKRGGVKSISQYGELMKQKKNKK